MLGVLNKMFDMNKRDLKRLDKIAEKVEELATQMEQLTDDQLTAKTEEFKERFLKGETLDDLQVKHLQLFVKRLVVCLACIHSVCKSLGQLLYTKVIFPR